jgi:hypothetical protein
MLRKLSLCLLLVGCTSTPPVVKEKPIYHPPLPTPYQVCQVKWSVYEIEDAPVVGLSYNDNVELDICLKDLLRYIKQVNNVLCHYRQDCDKDNNDTKAD